MSFKVRVEDNQREEEGLVEGEEEHPREEPGQGLARVLRPRLRVQATGQVQAVGDEGQEGVGDEQKDQEGVVGDPVCTVHDHVQEGQGTEPDCQGPAEKSD